MSQDTPAVAKKVEKLISVVDLNGYNFVAVKVTAAPYNGTNFDGNPFSFTSQQAVIQLRAAFDRGLVRFTPHPVVGFGMWTVKIGNGRDQMLYPGDVIIFNDEGELVTMVGAAVNQFLIINEHSDLIDDTLELTLGDKRVKIELDPADEDKEKTVSEVLEQIKECTSETKA